MKRLGTQADAIEERETSSKAFQDAYDKIMAVCTKSYGNVINVEKFYAEIKDEEIVYFVKVTLDNKIRWVKVIQSFYQNIEEFELFEIIYARGQTV
ncbi:hypothetical protein HZS_6402 [Henneguya salminicola]|nr:hypothetical protein HZS_6402 [Henneguya salminicola]